MVQFETYSEFQAIILHHEREAFEDAHKEMQRAISLELDFLEELVSDLPEQDARRIMRRVNRIRGIVATEM